MKLFFLWNLKNNLINIGMRCENSSELIREYQLIYKLDLN